MDASMKRRQEGFTLIESMVAFVMLVGGLLGVFQLHLTAKRGNHEAFEYTQAHALASAIVARMRLNNRQLSSYVASNYGSGTISPPLTACVSPPTDEPLCSPQEMAQWDQYVWDQMVAGRNERLGDRSIGAPASRTGCITRTENTVEVVVTWEGMEAIANNATSTPTPPCGSPSNRRRSILLVTTITGTP
jgi:type IV pilus assembly protein PilV